MTTISATVRNKAGIHVRPSGLIGKATSEYGGKITGTAKGMTVDLTQVIGLLTLGLRQGDSIEIAVDGPDEDGMAKKLKTLFETEFDFPPRE